MVAPTSRDKPPRRRASMRPKKIRMILKDNDARRRYDERIAREIDRLSEQLDVAFGSNPFRSLSKRFVIAASPRTGSTLLCERLLTHGVFVTEALQPEHVLKACRNRGDSRLETYCEKYLRRNTRNRVFGTKGWPPSLATLVLAGEFPTFIKDWGFVYLKRENVVRQAISKIIASRSSTWRAGKAAAAALNDTDFDAREIAAKVKTCIAGNLFWEEFFDLFGVEPIRITYEALARDPTGVAASVASYLDLRGGPIQHRRFSTPLQVQATPLNDAWEGRFRELERGGADERTCRQPPPSRPA